MPRDDGNVLRLREGTGTSFVLKIIQSSSCLIHQEFLGSPLVLLSEKRPYDGAGKNLHSRAAIL